MKIAISYPPLESPKGVPLLSQNRQFQWFRDATYIYPMVPAYAATLLKNMGFEVIWDDAIAEGLTYPEWLQRIKTHKPDLIALETKTPVVRRHWKIIKELKAELPGTKTMLMGDHVTALPKESMDNSAVDFVLCGGDYDFLLANLCEVFAQSRSEKGVDHEKLEPGIWYRKGAGIFSTGDFVLKHNLCDLPLIDRDLTHWGNYSRCNGNFKYRPGTYVMAARDCWWGRCAFCSWTTLYPGEAYRALPVDRHLNEIGHLIENYGVREIFDDSGCFPHGQWLEDFCRGVMNRGYQNKVVLGCNMRVGALKREQFHLLKQANFRFILMGLESVNQQTLARLNKNILVEQIEKTCRMAKNAGLEPHLTTMVGYPWESRQDAEQTIRFAERLFRKGIIDSLQATIVVPYPGTPLFEESRKQGWLTTEDWDRYDMKESVWKSPISGHEVMELTRGLYAAALSPSFLLNKIVSIRSLEDLLYLMRAGKKLWSHLADFNKTRTVRQSP